MTRSATIVLALAAMLAAPMVQARDLREILVLKDETRVLIDAASLKVLDEAPETRRRAVVSIDNSRNPGESARFAAADLMIEADCAGGRIAVLWSRGYGADGMLMSGAATATPHALALPNGRVERAALEAICKLP